MGNDLQDHGSPGKSRDLAAVIHRSQRTNEQALGLSDTSAWLLMLGTIFGAEEERGFTQGEGQRHDKYPADRSWYARGCGPA